MSVLFICHEFTNKEVQTDRELSSANLSGGLTRFLNHVYLHSHRWCLALLRFRAKK